MHSAIRAAVIVLVLALIASATGSPVAARRVQNGEMIASSAESLGAAERAKIDVSGGAASQYNNWYGSSSSNAGGHVSGKGHAIVIGSAGGESHSGPAGTGAKGYAAGFASD
jgi:hypothetical protein